MKTNEIAVGQGGAAEGRAAPGRHRWSDDDDLVAYYLSVHGDDALPMSRVEIAGHLGMSPASLRMREGNFRHLRDGGGGLANAAQRSRRLFETLKDCSERELRDRVLVSIGQA